MRTTVTRVLPEIFGCVVSINQNVVATGLSFINTLCSRSERSIPILMENNKNHQITLPNQRIGFSSFDLVDRDELKYQIRSPCELTNVIISTDESYNEGLLLHSTAPAQSIDQFPQIIYETENSILQQPNSIGHCISVDSRISKSFAVFLSQRISGLRSACRKARIFVGPVCLSGIQQRSVISTTLWLKKGLAINPTYRHCLKH